LEQLESIRARVAEEFLLFSSPAERATTNVKRVARSVLFRRVVVSQYGGCCAATRQRFVDPSGSFEVEAAHIVPVELGGSDDPRNGMALSRDFHWAFDKGLFTIASDRRIVVSDWAIGRAGMESLAAIHNQPLNEASNHQLRANADALEWHRRNVFVA
jgi:putative restriction endonuclease